MGHAKIQLPATLSLLLPGRVFIHPGSINFGVGRFDSGWLVYTEMVHTAKLYVRESSMVPVYALLLFGGEVAIAHFMLVRIKYGRHQLSG